jgi:hypothetical protein
MKVFIKQIDSLCWSTERQAMTELQHSERFEERVSARVRRIPLALTAVVLGLSLACSPARSLGPEASALDITDAKLRRRSPDCLDYAGRYTSQAQDMSRKVTFKGTLTIQGTADKCVFTSNSIPNHAFNDGTAPFVNPVKEVTETYKLPVRPVKASAPTALTLAFDNAIFLNGAKLDLLAAACYGVEVGTAQYGNQELSKEKIGCFDEKWAWRYDPMSPKNDFKADSHHAHAQPDGAYHYHGNPLALFDNDNPTEPSPVIGFAADGFPIYGPYINDHGKIRKVRSGYTLKKKDLKQKDREPLSEEEKKDGKKEEAAFPGGEYDGTYRDDYEFTGAGDLDECNGTDQFGPYGYYVTDTYPWVMGCFRGTPDESFKKKPLPGHSH